ncbi:MAG: hypothetical protein JNK82_25380, partial [Myxococcaceae bacterium]|nr:hypothetical protein [Myxococcaceae bacterium]
MAGGVSTTFPAPTPEGCIQNVTAGVREYTCDALRYLAAIPAQCLTQA